MDVQEGRVWAMEQAVKIIGSRTNDIGVFLKVADTIYGWTFLSHLAPRQMGVRKVDAPTDSGSENSSASVI